jgi:hypothetical protein
MEQKQHLPEPAKAVTVIVARRWVLPKNKYSTEKINEYGK